MPRSGPLEYSPNLASTEGAIEKLDLINFTVKKGSLERVGTD